RSTVANALEDLGWYVVDNLPPQMLRPLIELASRAGERLPKIAAVVDVRGRDFFADIEDIVHSLRLGTRARILFLEATDEALVRRFESVRRPHPLQGQGTLLDGIAAERTRLTDLRAASDIVIDSSDLNIHQLATSVATLFATGDRDEMRVTVMSFGFKYGVPTDADMVVDTRFLPNPFWVPELRHHTGLDEDVAQYVFASASAGPFLDKYNEVLRLVIDGYRAENKRHLVVAVGCTGGKHRSVAIAEELGRRLTQMPSVTSSVQHRDLGRE
ncbi:MAG TPA: RNase adapter RapZ, partial [Microbacteriaceae bacterium]|nr:RNase adapter RapZ [Microbacteriaceae bacterium]